MAYRLYVNDAGTPKLISLTDESISDEYPTRADIVAGCITAPLAAESSDNDALLTEGGDQLLGERTLLTSSGDH